jgi:hypothetical protein
MTDTLQTYALKPGCTEEQAKEVYSHLEEAIGPRIKAPGPGMSWLPTALTTLEEAVQVGGPIVMKILQDLIAAGLIMPKASPPQPH